MTTITVVNAGLREPSSTRMLADRLVEAISAEVADAQIRHIDLRQHAHAITDALLTGFPSGELAEALASVRDADALVLVTPTFQGSYAGLFKSFADLVEPDAVRGTPTMLAATGGSERHSLVIEHAMRPLAAYLGLLVVPTGVYAATADFGGPGTAELTRRIHRAARELRTLVGGVTVAEAPEPAGSGHAEIDAGPLLGSFTPFDELLQSVSGAGR